jgi:hypothetical protein
MKNVILTVVITILIGTIGVMGFLLWRDEQANTNNNINIKDDIVDESADTIGHGNVNKNSELNQDSKKNNCENENKVYFPIPELGVKVLVDKDVKKDLIYSVNKGVVAFTTKTLISIGGKNCSLQNGASPLGVMEIINGTPDVGWNGELGTGKVLKQFNDSFLAFYPVGIPCCDFADEKCAGYNTDVFYLTKQKDKECIKKTK